MQLLNIKTYKMETKLIKKVDPLDEDLYMPIKNLVHKYKNRVLFLVTHKCMKICDYCTRERKVGYELYQKNWNDILEYIKTHNEIDDVILSGGDPLVESDENIDYLLTQLSNIEHVEVIRIHTKMITHLPNRITDKLISILSKVKPLYMNIHISSLDELNKLGCIEAIEKLRNAGIILGSQSVLLRGVNDNLQHLTEMYKKLLKIGVKPYYLYQMDKTTKYDKYIVEQEIAIKLVNELRKTISGMACPRLVLDSNTYKNILA